MLELMPAPATTATAELLPPVREANRLSRARQWLVALAIPITLVIWMAVGLGLFQMTRSHSPAITPLAGNGPPDGRVLYAQHCATCHGDTGMADGPNSPTLSPTARRFGYDRFRLGSTTNGVPTDADLTAVIRRGIPGTAMPGFEQLTDAELAALVGHVRTLSWAGAYNRLVQKASESGDIDPTELLEIADRQCTPGDPVPVPDAFTASTRALEHGRQVYATVCASCHGPAGHGDGPQVKELRNEDGSPTRPRDLTSGVFKGGADPAQVYTRIFLGMPGTPMPASGQLPREDLHDVLIYILSLSRPGSP